LRSLDPCESFVRFFLRKPNEGMEAAVGWGGAERRALDKQLPRRVQAAVRRQWSSSARGVWLGLARRIMQGTHAGSGRESNGRRWEQERFELQAGDRWWLLGR
jgi:hypothetical protein